MDRIETMRHFVRVAGLSSFSAAARELGTTQSNVSRSVRLLEEHLGARLLQRTTRQMSLTPEGAEYLEHAVRILESVEQADSAVGTRAKGLAGPLRVFAPVSLGRQHVVPRLAEFLREHPDLEVDLILDDWPRDLVRERIDVALRVGPLPDSTEHARLLGRVPLAAVASPRWLRRKTLRSPSDLSSHPCVVFAGPITLDSVTFARGTSSIEVALRGPFRSNSSEAILAAAQAGIGFAVAPRWLVSEAIAEKALKEIFADWRIAEPLTVHAVYGGTRTPPSRVTRFIEFFAYALHADGIVS